MSDEESNYDVIHYLNMMTSSAIKLQYHELSEGPANVIKVKI